ncbi:hypothetical protein, partial [Wolbachia endosymbiont of Drosophila bicornuta]|uniref:hypothetical protein n=1 Tax=Wolbachia endosymbiont of Drosophila bicornuta TaxID=375918 RepID=UPI0038241601
TDRNMLLACYSHKHISYRIRTIIRKAIIVTSPILNAASNYSTSRNSPNRIRYVLMAMVEQ